MAMYSIPIPRQNIFDMISTAGRYLKQMGHPKDEIKEFIQSFSKTKSYEEACLIIEDYFPTFHVLECDLIED